VIFAVLVHCLQSVHGVATVMLYNFTKVQFPVPTFSLLSKNPEEKRSCVLSLNIGAAHVKTVSAACYNSVLATPETALMCMGQSISPGFQNNVKVKLGVLLRILLD
jgi:hypothetical protein